MRHFHRIARLSFSSEPTTEGWRGAWNTLRRETRFFSGTNMNYSTSSGGSLESQEGLDLALARTNPKQQAFSLRVTGGQNMNENLKPVLIAGAGPTGMMAAIELCRLNIPV